MNRKQLLMIVVAGLVLGGIGYYVSKQRSAAFSRTDRSATEKLLGDFPVNDVAQVTLRQNSNEVNLVKADVWTVKERGNYPANAGDIIEFARKLWDLHPAQNTKIGPSQLGRMELLAPDKTATNSALLVELKGKDGKLIRSLLLGKKSVRGGGEDQFGGGGWPNGRWIYLPDKPGTAYLVSESFSEIEPTPEHWLNKDFFHIEKPKTIEVEFPVATNSWKLQRETESGEWKLADAKPGEQLDSSKVAGVSSPFSSPSFNDVLVSSKEDQLGLDKPTVVKVSTFDDFNYTVKIGQKTNDNFALKVSVDAQIPKERVAGKDEKPEEKTKLDKEFNEHRQKLEEKLKQEQAFGKWTYLVASWSADPLLKERSQLMTEKKEESKSGATNDVEKVETLKEEGSTNAVAEPK